MTTCLPCTLNTKDVFSSFHYTISTFNEKLGLLLLVFRHVLACSWGSDSHILSCSRLEHLLCTFVPFSKGPAHLPFLPFSLYLSVCLFCGFCPQGPVSLLPSPLFPFIFTPKKTSPCEFCHMMSFSCCVFLNDNTYGKW